MGQYYRSLLCLLILFSLSTSSMSWVWSSSSSSSSTKTSENMAISGELDVAAAEFSIDCLNDDEKGIQRVKNARRKLLVGSKSCWHEAYKGILGACSEIAGDDNEKRKKFAWDLSNCFQKDSGRPPFPSCHARSPMKGCLEKLDDNAIHTYRGFFLETNSICHQLQLSTIINFVFIIFSICFLINFCSWYCGCVHINICVTKKVLCAMYILIVIMVIVSCVKVIFLSLYACLICTEFLF